MGTHTSKGIHTEGRNKKEVNRREKERTLSFITPFLFPFILLSFNKKKKNNFKQDITEN
jgi:hypothetical protein